MKKIFLAFAAVASLAACSKSEVQYDNVQNEITLAPVAKNITKAMVEGNDFPTSEKINLWAYYKPISAGKTVAEWYESTANVQTYLDHKTFAYRAANSTTDNNVWGGWANNQPIEYFWPKNGSLVFVGYHPEDLYDKASHNYATNTMHFENIPMSRVSDNTVYTEDFMYFNMTSSCSTGSVVANFKHALSWISVLLVKDDATSENATITVTRVAFTKVIASGDADVVGTEDIEWTADGNPTIVEILEGNEVDLDYDNEDVEPYQPLFIPQDMQGQLIVEYEIKSTDGSKFSEVKEITLDGMQGNENSTTSELSKWAPAKHYTYTITIGTTELLVKPTVTQWVGVDVPSVI